MKIIKFHKLSYFFNVAKDKFLMVIFIFCLLFSPPILPNINFIIPMAFISFLYIVFNYKKESKFIKKFFYKTAASSYFIRGFILYIIYVVLIISISGIYSHSFDVQQTIFILYRCALICPCLILCILFLFIWMKNKNYIIKDLMICLLLAASIQGFLSILSLIFPDIKNILVKVMEFGTNDPLLSNPWHLERRFFGFANNMYDSFGFGTGVLLALSFFCAALWSSKFLIFVPVLIFPALLNSRTGLLISCVGILFSLPLFFLRQNKLSKKRSLYALLGIVFFIFIIFVFIYLYSKPTYQWILSVLQFDKIDPSLIKLFGKNYWNFPKGILLLFGSGHSLYGAEGFIHSDVGLINDLWIGGIVGSGILYGTIGLTIWKAISTSKSYELKTMYIFFGVALILYNIKSIAITCNVGLITILLLIFAISPYETGIMHKSSKS